MIHDCIFLIHVYLIHNRYAYHGTDKYITCFLSCELDLLPLQYLIYLFIFMEENCSLSSINHLIVYYRLLRDTGRSMYMAPTTSAVVTGPVEVVMSFDNIDQEEGMFMAILYWNAGMTVSWQCVSKIYIVIIVVCIRVLMWCIFPTQIQLRRPGTSSLNRVTLRNKLTTSGNILLDG